MCIVAIAWQLFDDMPLVLLSNRDEFLHRPTLDAHQWQDVPIFAGRDQISGGTWLGYYSFGYHDISDYDEVNHKIMSSQIISNERASVPIAYAMAKQVNQKQVQNSRWATVLNFREQPASKQTNDILTVSRGQLITNFLQSSLSPMEFAKEISLTDYAGFNLIIGNEKQAVLMNNRGYAPTALHSGLHIISNGQPTDNWFKCERLRTRVTQEVLPLIERTLRETQKNYSDASIENNTKNWQRVALDILRDNQQANITGIPNTGLAKELEYALSSIFIPHHDYDNADGNDANNRIEGYGTRTQSILTLHNQQFRLIEQAARENEQT